MIETLSIKNFRGIHSLELDGLKRFVLIAGHNNCGKSSVIEAICAWANARNPGTLIGLNGNRGLNSVAANVGSMFYNTDITSEITISAVCQDKITRRAIFAIKQMPSSPIAWASANFEIISTVSEGDDKPNTYTFNESPVPFASIPMNNELLYPVLWFSPSYNTNLVPSINTIIINKQKKELIEVLHSVDDRIMDFQMANGNAVFFDFGGEHLLPYEVSGDGIKKIMAFTATELVCSNAVMLIDEIENGLHYSSLSKLWDTIMKQARRRNIQIIATTHSYEAIQAFAQCGGCKDDRLLLRLERDGDKHSAVAYNCDDINIAIGNSWEMR